jgi:hypothetical protein
MVEEINMTRNKTLFIIFSVIFILPIACQIGGRAIEEDSEMAMTIQEDIHQVEVLYNSQSVPDHFSEENAIRRGDEFDPNKVFEIFDHLKMEEGFTLDYVYDANSMGGYPELYARRIDSERYETLLDYTEAHPECFEDGAPTDCFYMNHVKADDTEEGFLQLVIFYRMGDQFYLVWHANYNDAVVIVGNEGLEKIIKERSDTSFGAQFTNLQQNEAKRIDPTPEVIFNDKSVTVKLVWFTKWGGFYKTTYQVARQFPHLIQTIETENLLEYECGIMF